MVPKGANGVGRFSIEFQVTNHRDVIMASEGQLSEEKVRRLTLRGVVDSGAGRLVLPKTTVKKLGLPLDAKTKVRKCRRPDQNQGYRCRCRD